jgi:hypothetical protein
MIPFTGCEELFIYLFTANPIPIKIAVTTRNPIIFFSFYSSSYTMFNLGLEQ